MEKNLLVSWGKPHLKKGPLGIGRENRLVRNIEEEDNI
jgi:hypothetical protein